MCGNPGHFWMSSSDSSSLSTHRNWLLRWLTSPQSMLWDPQARDFMDFNYVLFNGVHHVLHEFFMSTCIIHIYIYTMIHDIWTRIFWNVYEQLPYIIQHNILCSNMIWYNVIWYATTSFHMYAYYIYCIVCIHIYIAVIYVLYIYIYYSIVYVYVYIYNIVYVYIYIHIFLYAYGTHRSEYVQGTSNISRVFSVAGSYEIPQAAQASLYRVKGT